METNERLIKHNAMLKEIQAKELQNKIKELMVDHKPNTLELELMYKLEKTNKEMAIIENTIRSRDKVIIQLKDRIGDNKCTIKELENKIEGLKTDIKNKEIEIENWMKTDVIIVQKNKEITELRQLMTVLK